MFNHIEDSTKGSSSESDFARLFDEFCVNSNKLAPTVAKRNERLQKLLNGIDDMNLGDVNYHDIAVFGNAYEYLMTMYVSNAGKKEVNKVYDPMYGFRIIIMTVVNSSVNIRVLGLLLKFKTEKINSWCTV